MNVNFILPSSSCSSSLSLIPNIYILINFIRFLYQHTLSVTNIFTSHFWINDGFYTNITKYKPTSKKKKDIFCLSILISSYFHILPHSTQWALDTNANYKFDFYVRILATIFSTLKFQVLTNPMSLLQHIFCPFLVQWTLYFYMYNFTVSVQIFLQIHFLPDKSAHLQIITLHFASLSVLGYPWKEHSYSCATGQYILNRKIDLQLATYSFTPHLPYLQSTN